MVLSENHLTHSGIISRPPTKLLEKKGSSVVLQSFCSQFLLLVIGHHYDSCNHGSVNQQAKAEYNVLSLSPDENSYPKKG